MLTKLAALMTGVSLTACSVVGVQTVEEPSFTVVDHVGAVEIRQYGPRIVAQTTVAADVEGARGIGFRRIAGYIFGGNRARTSIAMTAPVAQGSETIAMTAPVAQEQAGGSQMIQFFMPKEYTLDSLPVPNDPAVHLAAVPAQTMAVLRFAGSIAPANVAAHQQVLFDTLKGSAWKPAGAPLAWFYNPPWTLPPFRRNEAVVPVTRG
jgi:hypothetical protein